MIIDQNQCDENSIEKSMQAVTDLLKSLLKQNKPSHTFI